MTIRSALTPLLVILLAAAAAYGISCIPTYGVAAAADPPAAHAPVAGAPSPGVGVYAVRMHPPVSPPPPPAAEPSVPDVERLWRTGAPLAAVLVALYLALLGLARFDPARALKWTGSAGAIGLLADAARAGVTPTASMWLAASAAIVALWARGAQRPAAPRDPQRGSAALPMLACVAIVLGAGAAWSCSSAGRAARAIAGDVVDCTTATARAHAAEYGGLVEQLIRSATAPSGEVDVAPLKAAAMSLGLETGGCAVATTIARLVRAEPQPIGLVAAPEPAPASLRRGFEALRAEVFAGARFRVELGGL